ncbi:MAG: photosynthetic reaction center subunit H [Pseudomonadota bacterium]
MVEVTNYIDVAQITLYVFWVFFAGLVIHLQMESRREGFPIENEDGSVHKKSWLMTPGPKTFHMRHGHGDITVPGDDRDARKLNAEPVMAMGGAALRPTAANPMLDSIGPGSYAERANVPDITFEGDVKIVPMRNAKDFAIAKGDLDPRGLRVVGCDAIIAGRVKDVWVDKAEQVIRYLEVELEVGEEGGSVLVPFNFTLVRTPRDKEKLFYVHAITGEQFAHVPKTRKRTEVTFLEEDKIMGYFGAGLMYATPRRQESVI